MLLLADSSFLARNPWFPGVVVAVALFAISCLINLTLRIRDKQLKTFDYRVISDVPLLLTKNKPERLKLMIGQLEVKEPRVTEICFKNTGNKAIDEDDFLGEPYTITRPDASMLDFNVIAKSHEHLLNPLEHVLNTGTKAMKRGDEEVWIRPRTLNKNDWFTLQIVYDGGSAKTPPIVSGRVRDESRPTAIYPTKAELQEAREWLTIGTMLAASLGVLAYWSFTSEPPGSSHTGAVVMATCAVGVLALALNSWRLRRKRLLKRLGHK